MPSQQPYNLVKDNEDPDLRVPVHAEQAFFQGIKFPAKVRNKINKKCNTTFFVLYTFFVLFFYYIIFHLYGFNNKTIYLSKKKACIS